MDIAETSLAWDTMSLIHTSCTWWELPQKLALGNKVPWFLGADEMQKSFKRDARSSKKSESLLILDIQCIFIPSNERWELAVALEWQTIDDVGEIIARIPQESTTTNPADVLTVVLTFARGIWLLWEIGSAL